MKIKFKMFFCTLIMIILCSSIVPAATRIENDIFEETVEIQPRTDIKEWIYAIIDGDLYKRLYNYSTARWETDWIFVAHGQEM